MHPELQQLDLEHVLAHVPTPLVVLQVGTGVPLYANRTARRLPFAYRELAGWTAIDARGEHLAGERLPHRVASRGERFADRLVHFVSDTGRFSLRFHGYGLGGDTCVLAFDDVTPIENPRRPDLLVDAEVEALASARCPAVVVENVLDANRIRAGAFALEVTHGMLADAVGDARALLGAHAAALEVAIADPGEGDWDRARMARVIANLVLDAIERGGGRVELLVTRHQGDVEVRARCSHTPATVARRSLAMFITREIVTAHRGVLDVQPALYRLVLPVAQ